jgi:hypothetical protein
MYWIMMYATPYIMENLSSLDFLKANANQVDGKTPFYDDETPKMRVSKRKGAMPFVRTRTTIHLKDSWVMRFTVREKDNVAIVKLSNTKRSADGYNVADLLWEGTRPYGSNVPTLTMDVPILYKNLADIGVLRPGGWKGLAAAAKKMARLQGKSTIQQIIQKGHHTGAMSFYNRYTGHYNYNRTYRRGIRDQLVTTFREYIVKCVEDGVFRAIEMMTNEGILRARIKGIHVRVVK